MKLFYLIAVVILLAVQFAAAAPKNEKRLCQIYCPDVYEPVCAKRGSTHKVFASECHFNAANMCGDGHKWTHC